MEATLYMLYTGFTSYLIFLIITFIIKKVKKGKTISEENLSFIPKYLFKTKENYEWDGLSRQLLVIFM